MRSRIQHQPGITFRDAASLLSAPSDMNANQIVKPPSRINGKPNPEYPKWWRKANPEKWALIHRRGQKKYAKGTLHDRNVIANKDEVFCLECQRLFYHEDALVNGFRFLRGGSNRVICNECQ